MSLSPALWYHFLISQYNETERTLASPLEFYAKLLKNCHISAYMLS